MAPDSTRPVLRWWLCLLVGSATSVVATIAIPIPVITYGPGGSTPISGGADALAAGLAHAVLNTVLLIMAVIYVVLFAAIVRQISRWQTDRFTASHG
jgi:hypothetical protein